MTLSEDNMLLWLDRMEWLSVEVEVEKGVVIEIGVGGSASKSPPFQRPRNLSWAATHRESWHVECVVVTASLLLRV